LLDKAFGLSCCYQRCKEQSLKANHNELAKQKRIEDVVIKDAKNKV
jgi:hypothetical protein